MNLDNFGKRGLAMLSAYIGAGAALTILPFLMPDSFLLNAFIVYFIYITLAVSWNLVGGYADLMNLGHGAFFGLGAYGYAFLSIWGLGNAAAMLIGALSGVALAILMVPTFRLRKDYFAVGTLALTPIMRIVFERILGVSSIIHLDVAESFNIYSFYLPALAILASAVVAQFLVVRSNFGLTLRAIGNEEDTAVSIGISPVRHKTYVLIISAYLAGLAGGCYTYSVGYILPDFAFSLNWSLIPIFMCLLGGRGQFLGPIIGALIYVVISQILTFTLSEAGANLLIFGVIILLASLFVPEGLAPHLSDWVRQISPSVFHKKRKAQKRRVS